MAASLLHIIIFIGIINIGCQDLFYALIIKMKKVTSIILTYREALMHIWNTYHAIDQSVAGDFIFEVDKAFSLVEKGLFDSLVQAKIFDYAQEPDFKDCWDIYVVPRKRITQTKGGIKKGLYCEWKDYEFQNDDTIFKFNRLFDCDQEGEMKGEFVRVKPYNSQNERPFTDYLFKIDDVEFYIKN